MYSFLLEEFQFAYIDNRRTGFIGSHLAEAYLERGDEVLIIDDLSTGTIENIRHLKENPRFHYTIDSVHNQPVTAELVDQSDVLNGRAKTVFFEALGEVKVSYRRVRTTGAGEKLRDQELTLRI